MRKEKKLYLWDWSLCESEGARFENFVASHLLKYCHFLEDTEGHDMQLCFLRDREKRELDFVVIKNKKPLFGVECKTGEGPLSEQIKYFSPRTTIPNFYQVHLGTLDCEHEAQRARVLPFATFCDAIGLV
jgi:predicted AAA+ superfamily ATPase